MIAIYSTLSFSGGRERNCLFTIILAVVPVDLGRLAVGIAISVRFPRTGGLIAPAMVYLALTGLKILILFIKNSTAFSITVILGQNSFQ